MTGNLICREEHRRDDVRAAKLFGLDYAEVNDDQRTLYAYFLGKAPQKIELANIRIGGGRRIRDVRAVNLKMQRQPDPTRDDFMEVMVNHPGDFSTYTMSVVKLDDHGNPTDQPFDGFDPRYFSVEVDFKAGCPSDLDCKLPHVCPSAPRVEPEINYLAKDYASFRQLILDRIALIMPDWQETHVPDLGIALVELLAYAGDYLSYYQDAVATEAYLGTARQRISVRRHARLMDYQMHEGCNARAWLTIQTDTQETFDRAGIYFITPFSGAPGNHVLTESDLVNVPASSYEIFEPLWPRGSPITIYPAHSEIRFYTWGDCECCLVKGATSATLIDRWVAVDEPPPSGDASRPVARAAASESDPETDGPPGTERELKLKPGNVLIFEEVVGPKTGNHSDADPKHRQAVRLTSVKAAVDPLYHPYGERFGQPVVEIEWAPEDALSFTLCISAPGIPPDCECIENVSVARGNVILVDHGGGTSEPLGAVGTKSVIERCPTQCNPGDTAIAPSLFRPVLNERPLTFCEPLPECGSARALLTQDPRQTLPAMSLSSIPPAPGCPAAPDPAPPCEIPPLFEFSDLTDPTSLAKRLKHPTDPASQLVLVQLTPSTKTLLAAYDGASPLPAPMRAALIANLTDLLETWLPLRDLLESDAGGRVFVAEMDNDGYSHLRFGDGQLGRMPDAGTAFQAAYRTGNGSAGNVGAETITYLVLRNQKLSGAAIKPRNPLPAGGGTDPEPIADVKLFAPYAFRNVLERAIIADDYSTLADDNQRRLEQRAELIAELIANDSAAASSKTICMTPFVELQGSKAVLRWTGSWYQVLVALDPEGREIASRELIEEVDAYLEPYRRIGHDLEVAQAVYIPLDLAMTVCVLPQYLRSHVESALLDVFSNRVLADGTKGFFHPDNLTFGEGIFVSGIIAAAQAVTGVQNVQVTRLERYEIGEPQPGEDQAAELPTGSVFSLGPLQIARLDNDPNFPENGRLVLDMRGGR
jgi:hypothetical protein